MGELLADFVFCRLAGSWLEASAPDVGVRGPRPERAAARPRALGRTLRVDALAAVSAVLYGGAAFPAGRGR